MSLFLFQKKSGPKKQKQKTRNWHFLKIKKKLKYGRSFIQIAKVSDSQFNITAIFQAYAGSSFLNV